MIPFQLFFLCFTFAVYPILTCGDNVAVRSEDLGNSAYIPGITVYGAVVVNHMLNPKENETVTIKRKERMSVTTTRAIFDKRMEYVKNLTAGLPFPLVQWPAMYTQTCSRTADRNPKRYERVLAYAHFQIWQDFIYFEDDYETSLKTYLINSQRKNINWRADIDKFRVEKNGLKYKNDVLFLEKDILVIFEDDAEIATVDYLETLQKELQEMIMPPNNCDLLYLGWCNAKIFNGHPLCTHAYAITRAAARILVNKFTPCGLGIDIQMAFICGDNKLKCRKIKHNPQRAHFNSNYPRPNDLSLGIFHQADVHGWFLTHEGTDHGTQHV